MGKFLKGNYQMDEATTPRQGASGQKSSGTAKAKTEEYETKARNSIGGSMVFVERRKVVWKPSSTTVPPETKTH